MKQLAFSGLVLAKWVECSPMVQETRVQSQVKSYQDSKMVLDATLLNTQYYKVRIKGKVEQSREWSSAFPLHLRVVAIEKGAFRSPSTTVANFTFLFKPPDDRGRSKQKIMIIYSSSSFLK